MTTTAIPTTSTTSCNPNFSTTIIQADHSIRLLDSSRKASCAFKKYSSYTNGDEIWFKTCEADNANANKAGKYQWSFDAATGQIKSKGAKDTLNKNFCWNVANTGRNGKQRVKIKGCEEDSDNQRFVVIAGRVHLSVNTKLCVGVEEYKLDEATAGTGIALTTGCFWTPF